MYSYVPSTDAQGVQERALADTMAENALLRGQVHNLSNRIYHLEAENAHLRSTVGVAPPPPPPAGHVYQAPPSENTMQLPTVIESLAVLQDHFRRQDALKQW
jgi:hypothetical protein